MKMKREVEKMVVASFKKLLQHLCGEKPQNTSFRVASLWA
jgi:hypothetical protein